MRTSTKTFRNQSLELRTSYKKPKDYVTKLNKQISCVQDAVKEYNQSEEKQLHWKKQFRMNGHTCPLKTLTEPKFQNILFQSNFNNKSLLFKATNDNDLKKSVMSKRNFSKKNSLYQTNLGLRKTFSFMQSSRRVENQENNQLDNRNISNLSYRKLAKSQKKIQNERNAEQINPQSKLNESNGFKANNFASFRQEVGRFDKIVYLSKNNFKKNYSQKNTKVNNFVNSSNFQDGNSNSVYFKNQINDRLTVIDQETKSIMMQSNLNSNNKMKNASKQSLLFLPITEQKTLTTLNAGKNSHQLRNKIQKKTQQLQKQWLKTQNFRQKFNIQTINPDSTNNKRTRIINKLDNIIRKVEQRRPRTSMKSSNVDTDIKLDTDQSRISNIHRLNSSPNEY